MGVFRNLCSVSILATVFLTGCNGGTIHRKSTLGGENILAVDARQRLVVEGINPVSGKRVVCAEPSPDAIVAQAASLASALSVPIPGAADGQNQAKSALATGFSESAASIGLRTQSIQLLRDGYYRICEALLNGQIGPDEYRDIFANIDGFMLTMLAIEQLGDKAYAAAPVQVSANVTTSVDPEKAKAEGNAGSSDNEIGTVANSVINISPPGDQAGIVAEHKSAAIVEIMRSYLENKKEIYIARLNAQQNPPTEYEINARYQEEYYRRKVQKAPVVVHYK